MTLADVFGAMEVIKWLLIIGCVLFVLIVALGLAALQWPEDR